MAERRHKTLLFLCTGNYYRSRFAEILFNSVARKMNLPWVAGSRGLALERGVNNVGPMAQAAIDALESMGIGPADFVCSSAFRRSFPLGEEPPKGGTTNEQFVRFPIQVTALELEQADRVIALKEAEHRPLLRERYPAQAEKVECWHIDDVPGVLPLIEDEIMTLVAQMFGGSRQAPTVVSEKSQPTPLAKKPATVKVGRETAGRRGKGVTTVFDVPLDEEGLLQLAAQLKQRCGTGGTGKAGRIEIQGDQRERLTAELEKLGYKVKRVGG
jgi:translation initiation factor 1